MVSVQPDPAVAETERRVSQEMVRFRAALPALLADPALVGRWVLFRDGVVVASFDSENDADDEGYRRFGELGGYVLARVEPQRVHYLGGAGFRASREHR
jgi:hypothetical protein